jgi:hypothetical protein
MNAGLPGGDRGKETAGRNTTHEAHRPDRVDLGRRSHHRS